MKSRITNDVLRKAEPIADTQQHIIIIGEYGSGKSWLAKKIHNASNRKHNPFININCYTLDTNEVQKKIFGYLQFTEDSVRINKGWFEKINGGTLCLEGFDALSERLQKKVLNCVENHNAHHIGSSKKFPIDVRTILSIDVKSYYNSQQKFDLFSNSLNIEPFTINYPPLRERREEIYEMVQNFLKSVLSQKYDFAANKISIKAMYQCIRYDWPGNVQQLKNAIEHAAIISGSDIIQPEHLPNTIKQGQPKSKKLEYLEKTYTYRIAEKNLIKKALTTCSSPQQLKNKLGLNAEDFKEKLKDYQIEPELT